MNNSVWYPYQQMNVNYNKYEILKADKEFLYVKNGKKLIDAISSWWASIHGYNHPALNKVLNEQANQFSHIMLGGLTHQPVQKLADKLVSITPEGLNHVFFSDSGSVAVEVALKMAIQYWSNQGSFKKTKFIALNNSYHGDTFKTMELGDDSDYQESFNHVLNKGFYTPVPEGGFHATTEQIQEATSALEQLLTENHETIAALVIEPVLQGAAGFQLHSPTFVLEIRKLCKKYEVLFICDEVATGFGRTGKLFACEHAGVSPDIMVLGKALTAGYIGHAATIASSKIFNAFLGTDYKQAFMHGPTFMGNPLACAVALKGIELFEEENYLQKVNAIEQTFIAHFQDFKHPTIKEVRVLGGMLVIEVNEKSTIDGVQEFAFDNGVWLRPFGNYLYATPPYIIANESLMTIVQLIKKWFNDK